MRFIRLLLAAVALVIGAQVPAFAQLAEGARAPNFATRAALAGEEQGFSLRAALSKGPVVLYFYPKAFTQGCTLEANAFAEAMPQFKAAGAQVVGMSADDVETLKKFSTEECRDAFPVARATPATIKAYDVVLNRGDDNAALMSDRTSYVIAPDGKIVMVHSDGDWREHVSRTLAAVRALNS